MTKARSHAKVTYASPRIHRRLHHGERAQRTLYLGVTGNLIQRAHQHHEGLIEGFSKRYGCTMLVWFEQRTEVSAAIAREKDIKKWRRAWKLNLIEKSNPQWRDLYTDFSNPPPPTFLTPS